MNVIEKINPSVKLFTGLTGVILLAFEYIVSLNLCVFGLSLVLLIFFSKARIRHIFGILVPAFTAAFGLFMMGVYYSKGNSVDIESIKELNSLPYILRSSMSRNYLTALQLSTRLLAFAGLGSLFALTTEGDHFVASLIKQCRIKTEFAYGLLAAVNLMPNLVKELKKVKLAYLVRGFKVTNLSFKVIFTMMVNSIRWSESVAMAMESKGFDSKSPRTYYLVPKIHFYDWIYFAGWMSLIIVQMVLN